MNFMPNSLAWLVSLISGFQTGPSTARLNIIYIIYILNQNPELTNALWNFSEQI